jgi:hypothetical protein
VSNSPPWDYDPLPDIEAAVTALRRELVQWLREVGHVTGTLCYDYIHETRSTDREACSEAFDRWWGEADEDWWREGEPNSRFNKLISQETPSAVLRAYFYYSIALIAKKVRAIFQRLIKIGIENKARLKQDGIKWALTQMRKLIRNHRYLVPIWVREVCGNDFTDPEAFADEFVKRLEGYIQKDADAARVYIAEHPVPSTAQVIDPMDAARSAAALKAAEDKWVSTLGDYTKRDVGAAYLEEAKRPSVKPRMIDGTTGKALAQENQGAKKMQPVFNRQNLINRVKNDRYARYSYAEAGDLLGYERHRIGYFADATNERREVKLRMAKRGWVFAKEVLQIVDPQTFAVLFPDG